MKLTFREGWAEVIHTGAFCWRCRDDFKPGEAFLSTPKGLRHLHQCAIDIELDEDKPRVVEARRRKQPHVVTVFGGLNPRMEAWLDQLRQIGHPKAALVELSDGRIAVVSEIFGDYEILAERVTKNDE